MDTKGINETLEERSCYGDYVENSLTVTEMKEAAMSHPRWHSLKGFEKESIEMILHKIGRILGSDADEATDSWHDIAGYATLAKNGGRLEENQTTHTKSP